MTSPPERDLASLNDAFTDPHIPRMLEHLTPQVFRAASQYWRAPLEQEHLTPRMRELTLLAMHAAASALNADAIARQVERSRAVGASELDILDTLITIVGLANHALYTSVPILEEELGAAGIRTQAAEQEPDPGLADAKRRFIAARGFWNPNRDNLAGLLPEYVLALTELAVESCEQGSLSPKDRELVCIAIDCTVNHTYEPGLRLHIRNALRLGASAGEILQVFELAGLLGLEGYLLGATALLSSEPA